MEKQVFLVEDNELVRQGYAMLIDMADGLSVCGEALTGREALEALADTEADVAIVDVSLPDIDGLDLTRQLRERWPALHVLVISGHAPEEYAARARAAGADGYVDKKEIDAALLDALETVLSGRPYG